MNDAGVLFLAVVGGVTLMILVTKGLISIVNGK